MNDNLYNFAIEVAKSSPSKKKVGSVLLYKNRVVATATNLDKKTHPLQARLAERVGVHQKIYLHSEIAALVKCRQECDTIIVARVNSQNKLRNSKPCPICSTALKEAGVSKVYYSTNEGFLYEYA